MHPTGARTSIETTSDGHGKLAVAEWTPSPKRTNFDGVSLVLASLGTANGAGFNVVPVSRSQPRGWREISAPHATILKRTNPSVTGSGLTRGGIVIACLALASLLLLPCYLKLRSRSLRSAHVDDVENAATRRASYDSGSHKILSVGHSDDLAYGNPSPTPPIPQTSSETAVPVSVPISPSSQGADGRKGGARLPARPSPLLLMPERPNRETRQDDSFTVARSRSIRPKERESRGSFLPNPWDSDAKPLAGALERVIFHLPTFSAPPMLRASSFKGGLPRSPRELRIFLSPEVRLLEATTFGVNRLRVEPPRRPPPI